MHTDTLPQAWYRQFWPWFLIALPLSSVIAGITTVFIAQHKPDTLVADNYYKKGLAINQEIARERTAAALGIKADLSVEHGRLMLDVVDRLGPLSDSRLQLVFIHPTLAQRDVRVELLRIQDGRYGADMPALHPSRWQVQLMPMDESWRVSGRWASPFDRVLELSAD